MPELPDKMDFQAHLGQLDQLELMEKTVIMVHLESLDCLAQQENQDVLDTMVPKVSLAELGTTASREREDLWVHKVFQVKLLRVVLLVNLDLADTQERKETEAHLDTMELLVSQESQDLLVPLVRQDMLDLLVPPVPQERPEHQALMGVMENQEHLVHEDTLVLRERQEYLDLPPLVSQERMVPQDMMVHQEHPAHLGRRVNQDTANQELQESQVMMARQVPQVVLELPVHQDHKVLEVMTVWMVAQEPLAHPA